MEKTEKGKINFSRVERALLLDLVDKHKAVLENKRTDAVSVARKRKEWELIETQFNSSHNVSPRTWLQLKKCWENWKNKWRKAKADDNREIFKTGGGSAAPSQLTEDLQRVGSVASHMGVRLANPFDSDRHQADPGGESQPTPSVAALLSRTQDGSVPGASEVLSPPPPSSSSLASVEELSSLSDGDT
ncbi:myb/SANT-like DNA-binding domain-containing protein 3 [Amblyomma americanum]